MGFIDYHGTKEDRYSEVLDHATMQQEEEQRRKEDAKVAKWLKDIIGDARYSQLNLNDTIKYVMVKYKELVGIKDTLLTGQEDAPIDTDILWNDFGIYIISRHLEPLNFTEDKRDNYYTTFASKVFKINQYTSAEKHYSNLDNNSRYRKYMSDCFDPSSEKQFWKWLGRIGSKDKKKLLDFITAYEHLTILLGLYLFQGMRPHNDIWMKRLEVEKQVLERIRADYERGHLKEPNYDKMHNPLFEPTVDYKSTATSARQEPFYVAPEPEPEPIVEPPEPEIEEPVRRRRPQLDKVRFNQLLEKQELMSYVEACRLLRKCELPEHIDNLYKELILRIPVLQESIDKYKEVYQPDMFMFYDYYIPEALQLTSVYIEYLDVGIAEDILQENEREVLDATNKLIIAVNDKVDEIYKYASIQLKAKAKALESIMSQNGHLDPSQKIN